MNATLDSAPAVRADDALLDALGGRGADYDETLTDDSLVDDDLNALLLAWRREVDARPMGELVDTNIAVEVIGRAATAARRDRHRVVLAVAMILGGALTVPVTIAAGGGWREVALVFPAGAASVLVAHALGELFGGSR